MFSDPFIHELARDIISAILAIVLMTILSFLRKLEHKLYDAEKEIRIIKTSLPPVANDDNTPVDFKGK